MSKDKTAAVKRQPQSVAGAHPLQPMHSAGDPPFSGKGMGFYHCPEFFMSMLLSLLRLPQENPHTLGTAH